MEKLRHAIGWDIGNNCVLSRSQANRAIAIPVGETSELLQLFGINSADWNAKSHGHKPGLFLRGQSDMVGMMPTPHIPSLKCEFIPYARGKFGPQSGDSPFFDQKGKPAFGASFARTVVTKNFDQLHYNSSCLVDFDKN